MIVTSHPVSALIRNHISRAAWDRVEAELPCQEIKSKVSPPRPISKGEKRNGTSKLSKAQEDALANRLSATKKTSKHGDKFMLQSEVTNCTFEPDIITARKSLDADKLALDHRKEEKMLRHIQRRPEYN